MMEPDLSFLQSGVKHLRAGESLGAVRALVFMTFRLVIDYSTDADRKQAQCLLKKDPRFEIISIGSHIKMDCLVAG